jgi:predicted acylesterase/phospholipase RssA
MFSRILIIGFAAVSLLGCSTSMSWDSVPEESVEQVHPVGYSHRIRYWGSETPRFINELFQIQTSQSKHRWQEQKKRTGHAELNILSISGGGQNGAYGAGVLNGWTKRGGRPQFGMVTGVSTGALTAPFAYLGADYDPLIKELYTTISTKDILKKGNVFDLVGGTAYASNAPLYDLISKYVDETLVAKIAAEHAKGRRLWILTTNLEAGRSVVWDIGEIAISNQPGKIELIRKILLASAAIPGVFPPVKIEVEIDGKSYEEVHVDGGTTNQAFVFPGKFSEYINRNYSFVKTRNVYVVRNGFVEPRWARVKSNTIPIAGRAVGVMLDSQGEADMYKIYAITRRAGFKYKLTYIPKSFDEPITEPFDNEYMNKLYQFGYENAVHGIPWTTDPFGF